jgi:hypothetical protein
MVLSQSCLENWFSSWVVQLLAHHHSVRTHLKTTNPTLAERAVVDSFTSSWASRNVMLKFYLLELLLHFGCVHPVLQAKK